jgi:hypothetical protein
MLIERAVIIVLLSIIGLLLMDHTHRDDARSTDPDDAWSSVSPSAAADARGISSNRHPRRSLSTSSIGVGVAVYPPQRAQPTRGCERLGATSMGPLEEWFLDYERGPLVHKWSNYFSTYELVLAPACRRREVRLLEIGIQSGGAIQMWRSFFGADRLLYTGLDINALSAGLFVDDRAALYHGSQLNASLLRKIIAERGPFDVVIDDGGHADVM